MTILIIISFLKEFVSTINTKLYMLNKNFIVSITCGIACMLGEFKAMYVLNIPITTEMTLRALLSALIVTVASLLAIPIMKMLDSKQDKHYEFIIRFKDLPTCEFVNMQLKEKGIHTYLKEDSKKIIADSNAKESFKTIWEIIDTKYKSLKINECKIYQ